MNCFKLFLLVKEQDIQFYYENLVTVGKSPHTTHDTEDIVVGGVNADFGSGGTTNGVRADNELE